MNENLTSQPAVRIVPLGSAGHVNRNMYVYEYLPDGQRVQDIFVVDCGVEFPDAEQLGVDLIIPDTTYLQDKLNLIRGVVITHAHEDHYGALPYLLKNIGNPPVYAAKLALGFIKHKLEQFGGIGNLSFHEIIPEIDPFELGAFNITPFRMNHSLPDTLGFFMNTPIGNLIHATDFKFDWTPVDGKQFEIAKLAQLSAQGVLLLASDSLGAEKEGFTHSEKTLTETFENVISHADGQVFITTISSNISRMQQAIDVSRKYGRSVCFAGRSIQQNVQVAHGLGYIDFPEEIIVDGKNARNMSPDKITYIITGCYAQTNSGLDRVSRKEHREIELTENATVLFSGDPIPGVQDSVGAMIDRLTMLGANVIYSEIQDNLHVSGHGVRGDLRLMVALTRPKYFMPIGGDPRHQRAYAKLVEDMGYKKESVFEMRSGDTLLLTKDGVGMGEKVEVQDVFVDGNVVGDVGNVVLRDRQILSEEGIVVVILQKDAQSQFTKSVSLVSRGFVYMADSGKMINGAERIVQNDIANKHVREWSKVKEHIEKKLSDYFYQQTGRSPMIIVFLIDAGLKK